MLQHEVHVHEVKGETVQVRVLAIDNPDDTGASHLYRFERGDGSQVGILQFHTGEIEPHHGKDVSGVTMESVLGAMIDRLNGFQSGTEKHKQHEFARKRMEEALKSLQVLAEERKEYLTTA